MDTTDYKAIQDKCAAYTFGHPTEDEPWPTEVLGEAADAIGEQAAEIESLKADLETVRGELRLRMEDLHTAILRNGSQGKESLEQKAQLAAMRAVVEGVTFPSHGDFGGPLVMFKAFYEDGSEASRGKEPQERARQALAPEAGKDLLAVVEAARKLRCGAYTGATAGQICIVKEAWLDLNAALDRKDGQ